MLVYVEGNELLNPTFLATIRCKFQSMQQTHTWTARGKNKMCHHTLLLPVQDLYLTPTSTYKGTIACMSLAGYSSSE